MNQLYWKEWRELRLMPLMAAAVFAAILMVIGIFCEATHQPFTFDATIPTLVFVLLIFWVAAGAGTFSQEVGSGTLQFMSVLPVSRARFWLVKVSSALAAALASTLLTTLCWCIFAQIVFPTQYKDEFHDLAYQLGTHNGVPIELLVIFICALFGCLAAGICAAPFFDRPISATVAAIVGAIFYTSFVAHLYGQYGRFPKVHGSISLDLVVLILLAIIEIGPLIGISYFTFTLGESLKSAQRFKVGAIAALGTGVLSAVAFSLGSLAKVW